MQQHSDDYSAFRIQSRQLHGFELVVWKFYAENSNERVIWLVYAQTKKHRVLRLVFKEESYVAADYFVVEKVVSHFIKYLIARTILIKMATNF